MANDSENVKDKVAKALEKIFRGLAGLDGTTGDEQAVTVGEMTFRCAAELGMLRVKTYWQFWRADRRRPESEPNKGDLWS